VHHIIQATGQYVDDVSVLYFQGMHRWVPIISRKRFNENLIHSRGPPTADFSILLLCMCLITYCPKQASFATPDLETLYLTTKTLFAQLQGSISASTNLVQAGILLSGYEYAHGRADASFISIGTCARMAYALGFHKSDPSIWSSDTEAALKAEEEKNVWWAIVIFERYRVLFLRANSVTDAYTRTFNCEITTPNQPFATEFPDINGSLPSEADVLDRKSGTNFRPIIGLSVTSFIASNIGGFGRHAQAAYLLDQVLKTIKMPDLDGMHTELSRIDSEMQLFLGVVMEQSCGTWAPYCAAISITIRYDVTPISFSLFPQI
jgi:hypothetical protein